MRNNEISDLSQEIETCRTLLDLAVKNGQGSLANQLLSTMAKLSREWNLDKFRRNEVLSRDAVMRVGEAIGRALAQELKLAGVPHFEQIVDRVNERLALEISEASNDAPRLEYAP